MMRLACLAAVLCTAAAACSGPADCAMLGECVKNTCVCDSGFTGDMCDMLDLGPAPSEGAVMRGNGTWGGHPVLIDGRYHTYVSDIGPCGLHRFKSFSRIIHLSSDKVEGPYSFEDEAIESFAHNAYPIITPKGELLLWYIGEPFNAGSLDCLTAPNVSITASEIINVAHSESGSPSGPWTVYANVAGDVCPDHDFSDWCGNITTNPAPYVYPNGTTVLLFHGRDGPKMREEAPGVAMADTWKGPFKIANPDPIFKSPAVWFNTTTGVQQAPLEFHGEDFFLWKGKRAFHTIWHVKEPFGHTNSEIDSTGNLAWSLDGIHWTPGAHIAYNQSITWASSPNPGPLFERQRPQIVFTDKADPYRPTWIFQGVQNVPSGTFGALDWCWNMVVPFNQ